MSDTDDDYIKELEAELEKEDIKPRGDFNVSPVARRKQWNKNFIIPIIIVVTVCLGVIGGIIWAAVSKIQSNSNPIDSSKVQADPALKTTPKKDDDMAGFMQKLLPKSEPKQPPPAAEQPPATAQVEQPDRASRNERGNDRSGVPVEQRPAESIFASVNRFDSGGMSAGSTSSGNYSSAGSGSSDSDPDLERAQAALRDSNAAVAAASAAAGQPDSGGGLSASTGSSSRGDLSSLTGNNYAMAKAYKAPNGKFLLKRRTRFQCVLYDAVRTDHPGFVSCYLTRPLLSSDGSVILAEKGAEINGEQSVEMKAGQTSVFTTWTDLETNGGKEGVRARLNGLGTGPMGTSGTDAYVDNHWGQRIGGAVMLSGTQDVLKSLSNLTQKSGSGYTVNNSEQNTEDMASKLLENSMNISPTGYLLPGTVINVIVAQDIDFSSVYTTR